MSNPDRPSAKEGEHETRGGVYVVGYFDLLGQSNALEPFIDFRGETDHFENLQREMSRLVNQLWTFREDFTGYFDGATETKLTDVAPAGVTEEQLTLVKDYQSPRIRIQGFSDTIVVYVPLTTPTGQVSLYGIWPLITSVAITMLHSFARGVAVRGAIDASWGTEPFEGEFYGPALLSVYRLENKAANWPRVVLGPGIQRLWSEFSQVPVKSEIDRFNISLARLQTSWTFIDVDGTVAVDYLGASMCETLDTPEVDLPALIDVAHVRLELLLRDASGNKRVREIIKGALNYVETRQGPLTELRRKQAASFYGENK